MNLPNHSITGYTDFHKKLIHQLSRSKHVQVTATALFGIRQRHGESLREFLVCFSEETIKVSNPNQEMFVAAFQNGLKAVQFNESLAQKPTESMHEIMKRAKCYIRGEESNTEKRSQDAKERGLDSKVGKIPDRGPRRGRGRYGSPYEPLRYDRDERRGRPLDSYTPDYGLTSAPVCRRVIIHTPGVVLLRLAAS
jgi:hypothetical protein